MKKVSSKIVALIGLIAVCSTVAMLKKIGYPPGTSFFSTIMTACVSTIPQEVADKADAMIQAQVTAGKKIYRVERGTVDRGSSRLCYVYALDRVDPEAARPGQITMAVQEGGSRDPDLESAFGAYYNAHLGPYSRSVYHSPSIFYKDVNSVSELENALGL